MEEAKNNAQHEIQKAQKKAKEIRDKELIDRKNSERELQKKRQEIKDQENALNSRIEKLDARAEGLEKRADMLREKENDLAKLKHDSEVLLEQQQPLVGNDFGYVVADGTPQFHPAVGEILVEFLYGHDYCSMNQPFLRSSFLVISREISLRFTSSPHREHLVSSTTM